MSREPPVSWQGKGRVWLINDAHDLTDTQVFTKNINFQIQSAVNRGIHGFIQYGPQDLDAAFRAKNADILNQKTGAGYWLWKPYVVLKALNTVPEGDLVWYLDSAHAVIKQLSDFYSMIEGQDILAFQSMGKSVRHRLRKDAFQAVALDEEYLDDPYVSGNHFLLRNTYRTKCFVRQWLSLCAQKNLLLDAYPLPSQHKGFETHMHDTSLLMLRCALSKKESDPLQVHIFRNPSAHFPPISHLFWHHRHPHQGHKSLMHWGLHLSGKRDLSMERPISRRGSGRIWLVTYAADCTDTKVFQRNMNFQTATSGNRGIHGWIQYGPEDLEDSFKTKHDGLFKNKPRGAGLWVWKPHIMSKALKWLLRRYCALPGCGRCAARICVIFVGYLKR